MQEPIDKEYEIKKAKGKKIARILFIVGPIAILLIGIGIYFLFQALIVYVFSGEGSV